jgi:hypothetical protein
MESCRMNGWSQRDEKDGCPWLPLQKCHNEKGPFSKDRCVYNHSWIFDENKDRQAERPKGTAKRLKDGMCRVTVDTGMKWDKERRFDSGVTFCEKVTCNGDFFFLVMLIVV